MGERVGKEVLSETKWPFQPSDARTNMAQGFLEKGGKGLGRENGGGGGNAHLDFAG